MSDATCELSDRFHFLRLSERVFSLSPISDLQLNPQFERRIELAQLVFSPPALQRNAEQVCDALQEINIVLCEGAGGLAVRFKDSIRMPFPQQNHVSGPLNAVFTQKRRRPEALLS